MSPKNTRVPIAFVASGAAIAGVVCVFARKAAHAGSFPSRNKLTSMRKSTNLIQTAECLKISLLF